MSAQYPTCGTAFGFNTHRKHGTPNCDDCKDAQRRYMQERRRALASGCAFTFPIERLVPDDFDGFGVTIARSLRESA